MADANLPTSRFANAPSARDMLGWVARGEVGLAVGVVGIVVLLILPIPAFLLDMLLAISITSAVLILMTSLLIKKPLEFTASRWCCWSPPSSGWRSTSPRRA